VPVDTFAARLVLARLHAGNLTLQQAAARCGLVDQSWSNWERGAKPRDLVDVVAAISESLGIDRDWLMYGGPLSQPERPIRRLRSDRTTVRYQPGRHPTPRRPGGWDRL